MVRNSIKAFFEIHGGIVSVEGAKKISATTVMRSVYGAFDWAIAALLGSMVFWMNARGFSERDIFLATFLYDFVASAAFFWLSDWTGFDLTLGQSFRRAADSLKKESGLGRVLSGLLLLVVSIKAIIWEGPEVICFLFRRELGKRQNIWLALFGLSAIQGAFGSWLYTTGYEWWSKFRTSENAWELVLVGAAAFGLLVVVTTLGAKAMEVLRKIPPALVLAGGYVAAIVITTVAIIRELMR